MAHKAIHYTKRGIVILFEIACFLVVVGLVAWGGLLWRLSQGPLQADFLTRQIERSFVKNHPGFDFVTGSTMLTWGGKLEPFEVELRDVSIKRGDDVEVLKIDKVGIQLSKRHLIVGMITPETVRVYNPSLRIMRWEDGQVTLNMETQQAQPPAEPSSAQATSVVAQTELIRGFLMELQGDGGPRFLKGLQEIEIMGAQLVYEDKALGVEWSAPKADLIARRENEGLSLHGGFTLDMGESQQAFIKADVAYNFESKTAAGNFSFSGLIPARLSGQNESLSEKLKELAQVELPLKGSIDFQLDENLKLGDVRFALGADPGTFNAFGLYQKPLEIRSAFLSGHGNGVAKSLNVDQLKLDIGGPVIEATGGVSTEGSLSTITVQAGIVNMPMDDLPKYWPEKLTPDPRSWVTSYLTKGIADKSTLDLSLGYDAAAEEGKRVIVNKVAGKLDYHGIKVDYYNPLTPATDAKGTATFDNKSFSLDIASGKLEDMKVTHSTIHITDLDVQDDTHNSHIDISVDLQGPLKTALKVLDSKPLEYPKQLGIKTADVDGQAQVNVKFKFPLHKSLEIDQVDVHADAKLSDVKLGGLVSGMDLTGGPMDLTVDSGAMKVKGEGKLGGMPLTFDWVKNFNEKTAFSSQVKAKISLDGNGMTAFGVPADLAMTGTLPADVVYTLGHDGRATLDLKGDIAKTGFTIPVVGYTKKEGDAGSLAMQVQMANDNLTGISGLDLATEAISVKGDIGFNNGNLQKASFRDVRMGDSQVSVDVSGTGGDAGYDVRISGKQLDASGYFKDDPVKKPLAQKEAEAAEKTAPLKLSVDIGRLITGKDKGLEKVRMTMQRNAWRRMDRLEMTATSGGAPFTVQYVPAGGGHSMHIEAQNAGAVLGTFGIIKSIRGGKLVMNGKTPANGGARDLKGMATLSNFTLKDAPVIARLVNAMSLPGILSLLSGEGISFEKARVDYSWVDRGQPDQPKNVRMLKLWDGKTSGASLGLTFEGNIDNWADTYDLSGTIVPVSQVSKFLNMIPILGSVLTANGEGIIAATYTIKGPKDDPTTMVNPLSVLAPGILRKIFFEN